MFELTEENSLGEAVCLCGTGSIQGFKSVVLCFVISLGGDFQMTFSVAC